MIIIRPIIRPLLQAIGEPSWTPLQLFASGEQGAWYDISEISSLYQNDNFTTSVTASGQAVGGVLDLSGNGNHAINSNAARRPDYIESGGVRYLLSDGVDDVMETPTAFDWGSDIVTIVAGVYQASYSGWLITFGGNPATANRSWGILGTPSGSEWRMYSRGTTAGIFAGTNTPAPPAHAVVTGVGHISGPLCSIQINDLSAVNITDSQGTGGFTSSSIIRLFNRITDGSVTSWDGRLYSLVAINRLLTEQELNQVKAWTQSRMP